MMTSLRVPSVKLPEKKAPKHCTTCLHRYLPGDSLNEALDKLMQSLRLGNVAAYESFMIRYDAIRAIAHHVLLVGSLPLLMLCCTC